MVSDVQRQVMRKVAVRIQSDSLAEIQRGGEYGRQATLETKSGRGRRGGEGGVGVKGKGKVGTDTGRD